VKEPPPSISTADGTSPGIVREDFLATRGISINTYKSQVRSILQKTSLSSLNEVREELARMVFASSRAKD
jgi:hypothetical protein